MNKKTLATLLLLLAVIALAGLGLLGAVLYYAAWTFIVIVVIFIALGIVIPSPVTEDDVYDALSLTVWKTAQEIEVEIKRESGKPEKLPLTNFIRLHLDTLERERFAESRDRIIDAERLARRGGYGEREFRRASRGGRKRKARAWTWKVRQLIPQHAMQ